jgi:hypothetical protein
MIIAGEAVACPRTLVAVKAIRIKKDSSPFVVKLFMLSGFMLTIVILFQIGFGGNGIRRFTGCNLEVSLEDEMEL